MLKRLTLEKQPLFGSRGSWYAHEVSILLAMGQLSVKIQRMPKRINNYSPWFHLCNIAFQWLGLYSLHDKTILIPKYKSLFKYY